MLKYLIVFLFPLLTLAEERPTIPEPGEDRVLTGGISAKEFFEARQKDTDCFQKWNHAFEDYQKLKSELNNMLAKETDVAKADEKEEEMLAARSELLDLTEVCGPCKTQKMKKQTIISSGEYWSITDGSCFLPSLNVERSADSFEKAMGFLLNTKGYARHRGGFDSVLEFVPIDRKTGAVLPHVEKVDISQPIDTFITVRAKNPLFKKTPVTFNYSFENKVEIREANGKKEFILRFSAIPQPESLNELEVFDTTLAGTKRPIKKFKTLNHVLGMWYFNSDGYYRYFTAADFESVLFSSGLGSKEAERTLLDTVLSFAERGL